jgi:hypothetical protein
MKFFKDILTFYCLLQLRLWQSDALQTWLDLINYYYAEKMLAKITWYLLSSLNAPIYVTKVMDSAVLKYGTVPILAYENAIPVLQDIFSFQKAVLQNICSSPRVPYPVPFQSILVHLQYNHYEYLP